MRILAINGSPKANNGNTECILEPFLKGAESAGAETETVYLANKNIKHCTGCYSCWTRTPGVCIHKDDMPELLGKIQQADVLVFASPLYYFNVTGLMKDFIDRMLPLVNPELESRGGRYIHSSRYKGTGIKKRVLISNCGFPGRYNFSGLLETFKVMTGGTLDAAILCTEGGVLGAGDDYIRGLLSGYFSSVKKAGRELVEHGSITRETQEVLDREFMDPEVYMENANMAWREMQK